MHHIVAERLLVKRSSQALTSAMPNSLNRQQAITPAHVSSASTVASGNVTRSPSILVILSSHWLKEAVINSKIKTGKLHTSELTVTTSSGYLCQLPLGLININEFLSRETFKLNGIVRKRAKQPGSGFSSFTRRGQIYVRRKNGDAATDVTSLADLDRFFRIVGMFSNLLCLGGSSFSSFLSSFSVAIYLPCHSQIIYRVFVHLSHLLPQPQKRNVVTHSGYVTLTPVR